MTLDCLARLRPRPEKWFAGISVRQRLQDLRPIVGVDFSAQLLGSRPAVPAYLFHVIVEFDAVSVRVEGVGCIVNAGMQSPAG